MDYKFKLKPYEHQMSALESLGTKRLMDILWKWVQVKQKY